MAFGAARNIGQECPHVISCEIITAIQPATSADFRIIHLSHHRNPDPVRCTLPFGCEHSHPKIKGDDSELWPVPERSSFFTSPITHPKASGTQLRSNKRVRSRHSLCSPSPGHRTGTARSDPIEERLVVCSAVTYSEFTWKSRSTDGPRSAP